MKKRMAAILACLLLACTLLNGCAQQKPAAPAEATQAEEETAEEENYDTGDASLDDPRNADGIGERELLVVSFGTSYNDNRRATIGAIEAALEKAFPDWSVRRAFTSQIIIDHVKSRDGEVIDNVGEALSRAAANGVKTLVVQPTHLMNGFEYNDLVNELAQYADAFEQIAVGEPLLTSEEDLVRVANLIALSTKVYDNGETAICFMGHGTEADSNAVYARIQQALVDGGFHNYYVGTVEAEPSVEDVLAAVQKGSYQRVVLEPLMIVAGDHANNDMAGDEPDSWKSIFESAGYKTVCLLRGLGEQEWIQSLFVEHAQAAIQSLEEGTQITQADADSLTPVAAAALREGTCEISVDSSSSMFKIERCELSVADGSMQALLSMSSASYGYLYPGTAEEAAAADTSARIEAVANAEGKSTFVFPVEALDQGLPCAAWSRNKEQWYDRTLVFRADSLPADAFLSAVTAEGLADGAYTVAAALAGGSGRASVASPCRLWVRDGAATAEIVWSSANYDYMRVDGVQYDAVIRDGHSVCVIPVQAFDRALAVTADTTAMSQPHEIEYTLRFDASTLKAAEA